MNRGEQHTTTTIIHNLRIRTTVPVESKRHIEGLSVSDTGHVERNSSSQRVESYETVRPTGSKSESTAPQEHQGGLFSVG